MTPNSVPDEFCRLLDSTSDPIVIVDETGRVAFVNTRAEKLFGYGRAELFGRPAEVLIPEWFRVEDRDRTDPGTRGPRPHLAGGTPSGRRKDGTEFPVRVNRGQVRIDGRFVLAIVTDISARAGEVVPHGSEDLFRGALENTGVPTALADIENRFVRVNAAFARAFGYSQAEMLGMATADITHPDDLSEGLATGKALLAGRRQFVQTEKRYLHRDGHVLWGLTSASLVRGAGERAPVYLVQVQDVTAWKLIEDEARLSAARVRALFEATTAGIVEVAPDARILRANDAFCQMIGYTPAELSEMPAADVLFPEDRTRVLTQYGEVAAGRVRSYEADRRYRRKDGSALRARVSVVAQNETGTPARVSAVIIDLTERKHIEEPPRPAQKAEPIGQFVGGVAHDINNLLTVINGYAEMLFDGLPGADPTRELVQGMSAACHRAADLTRQLLVSSRKATFEPKALDLNEVVVQSTRLLRHLLGPSITLGTDLADGLKGVRADPAQMEQVILNLAGNARDAMPQGGRLTIETRGVRLREEDRGAHPDLAPGEYIQLAVSDTGAGMTHEVKARAFEPFFTTKEVGKGTGLGLAVVHEAINQWGGRVDVSSELGAGTTFKILLPAFAGPARFVPRGAGTVLLVENEGEVRELARRALETQGYRVLEASGGAEALRLAREHTGPIELLMTDVVMPEVGGREVADVLRVRHPGIKVLYVSGPADDTAARRSAIGATDALLQKPFTPMSLTHKVRTVIGSTA